MQEYRSCWHDEAVEKHTTGQQRRSHPWDRIHWSVTVDLVNCHLLHVCGVDEDLHVQEKNC